MRRLLARSIYYPTLGYNLMLGRVFKTRNWWDPVDEHLILGARPFARDVPTLKTLGVTGVVNMCEEHAGYLDLYQLHAIEQLWLPTIDFTHPTKEMIESGAEFIQSHALQKGKVYVHCKAGRARSATVVLWWLVKYRGHTPQRAQEIILASRPHANPHVHLRPVIRELHLGLQTDVDAERQTGTESQVKLKDSETDL